MTKPLLTIPCVICGTHVPGGRRVQAHCLTDECNLAYAYYAAEARIEVDGDHKIWHGQIRRGVAWVSVVTSRVGPNQERQDYRVLDLQRGEFSPHRRYRNVCGVKNCVAADHNEVVRAKPRQTKKTPLSGHLPPEPLVRLVKTERYPLTRNQRHYVEKCQKRGYITVKMADEFCIDVLKVHPAQLWGEEFYTA